ncbi:MAG: aspartate dehydrogenase [Candidatus Bathyarchaeota archaeon]|nr:aspartate dehydrogenase [Candidatus Bathyarchaeota archaeon]
MKQPKAQRKTKTSPPRIVGLIGCGAIGTVLAEAIARKLIVCDELTVYDVDTAKAQQLKKSLRFPVTIAASFDELLERKPTVIIEAASQQAAKDYAPRIVAEDIALIVLSTGALLGLNVDLSKVYVPSGAIGGLDAIASAALAGIDEAVLTSRKNPRAFGLDNQEVKLVYEGSAEEAVQRFPREMNVAATLALAVKPAKVKVQVLSDPAVQRNTHEIKVKWRFGEMLLRFANDPHPENPHTSALAAWSAIKLLKTLLET